MKSKYALAALGAVILVAALFIFWPRHEPPVNVPANFNDPAPVPTPCITPLPNSAADPIETCKKGCGQSFNHGGNSLDNATKIACCPAGFKNEVDKVTGKQICVKIDPP